MDSPFSATAVVLGVVALAMVIGIVLASTPKARARRAEARRQRRETAELRSRVAANARRTYDKQFPSARRSGSGSTSYSGGTVTYGDSGGSSCDSGSSGDSGGGGGDGGGGC